MPNGKTTIIWLKAGLIKRLLLYKMSQYFRKTFEHFDGDISTKLDLSSYATKVDLKKVTGVDISIVAKKVKLS